MKMPLTSTVSWVGKVDRDLLKFHGDEFSTRKGSSYNIFYRKEGDT